MDVWEGDSSVGDWGALDATLKREGEKERVAVY